MVNEKVSKVVESKGVKMHIFMPSQRVIYTVVGKEREYWLDPEINFCSCKQYYYRCMSEGKQCYHLEALALAREYGMIDLIKFRDDEYQQFIYALINDMFRYAR